MKRKKYIELCGHTFEVCKPIARTTVNGDHIKTAYTKPSHKKVEIYNEWYDVCRKMHGDVAGYGVVSHSDSYFSVAWTTSEGLFYITYAHKRFYPFEG